MIAYSLAFAAWAAWASLLARERTRGFWWIVLAAFLLAIAAAPWIASVAVAC